ncbi:MAG: hypothetical protein AAGI12_08050 [Pseudomonadota bacterium]
MKPANSAPVYACMYQGLADLARDHGYALAAHGSLARDFDLIAVPWAASVSGPEVLVRAVLDKFAFNQIGEMTVMKHRRLCWTLSLSFGDTFLDFSVIPTDS